VHVPLNLVDLEAIDNAVDAAVAGLGGRLDVVVNNAIYQGSGRPAKLLDRDRDELINAVTGNVIAQILITRRALRHMVPAGGGLIVDVTSNVSQEVPPGPVGRGGWELVYSVSKAGFHRIADMVAVEYGDSGIRTFNVNPGIVATEKLAASGAGPEFLAFAEAPEVIGAAIAALVDDPAVPNGGFVHAAEYAAHLGLITVPKQHPAYQHIPAPWRPGRGEVH
jgi:NAD(P)-dependent dehydrogenase (short-subunit alcohol dehydrogenase family)